MAIFFISVAALILGYIIYGTIVDRIFGSDQNRTTPAVAMEDGVDFVPMPTWKVAVVMNSPSAGKSGILTCHK